MKQTCRDYLLINPRAKHYKWHFALQCLLFTLVVLAILLLLGQVMMKQILGAVGASSLAATAFIAFTLPQSPVAKPRRILGSYLICLLLGALGSYIAKYVSPIPHIEHYILMHQIVGAGVAGCAMFFMVLFDVEHPPAAGFSLGLMIDHWNHWTLLIVAGSIVVIVMIAWILQNWLVSLVNKAPKSCG